MDPSKAGSTDQSAHASHAAASPSPSPALSAYSSTTSNSSFDNDNDYDLNSLSLDDWGYPQRNADASSPERSGRRISPTNTAQAKEILDGTSTPIAKRHPLSSLIHGAKSSFPFHAKSASNNTTTDDPGTPVVDEEDDEDLEPTGFDIEDEDEEDMHAHGVPAARGWRLKASKAKTPAFRSQVLAMFSTQLKLETWSDETVDPALLPLKPENVGLKRISGAFSNAVFFVSYNVPPGVRASGPRTVLLRVYGSGTEVLLSRRTELLILHTLSSLYEIGPHILGTFANGRVETYFDAEPIGKDGMRDLGDRRETLREDGSLWVEGKEGRAQWLARRMRQLHEVPLETMRAVLEQGDLRTGSGAGSSLFGRGIENHLFARSHRPLMARNRSSAQQQSAHLDGRFLPGQTPRDSPAPMTPGDGSVVETSVEASGADGARVQAMAIRGHSTQHRANSVASFDSLATSYNSQDGGSISSDSTDDLLISPSLGPSSYSESVAAVRKGGYDQSPYTFRKPTLDKRRSSNSRGGSGSIRPPYPGVWRRTKRWAREAGKVFALVDEFSQTEQGREACKEALQGTILQDYAFTPFPLTPLPRTSSLELGTTVMDLRKTLLAIASIDFPRLVKEMDAYKRFARRWERTNGSSKRVLTHGDTQYSNLLLIKDGEDEEVGVGMPRDRDRSRDRSEQGVKTPSRQRSRAKDAPFERLIVIDFEYCSPNPRAYDIANAFHEWRFDYLTVANSWSPYEEPYPTRDERRRWLRAYVEQGRLLRLRGRPTKTSMDSTLAAEELQLPPSMLSSTGSQSNEYTAAEVVKARYLDKSATDSPSKALGSRNKISSGPAVASPSLLPTSSPAVNAAASTASPSISAKTSLGAMDPASIEREIDRLEAEVQIFSVACHANWALWGITFAKEQIEAIMQSTLDIKGDESEITLSEEVVDHQAVEGAPAACSAENYDNVSGPPRH